MEQKGENESMPQRVRCQVYSR